MSIHCRFIVVLLLGSIAATYTFHVGDKVVARWNNNKYYTGEVEELSHDGIKIRFTDGDEITHSLLDKTAVFHDKVPTSVWEGTHVIAKKDGGGEAYYIGFIVEVKGEPPKLKLLFDETDDPVDFHLPTLRIFDDDGVCSQDVGARVFARWPDGGLYYRGFVSSVTLSEVSVKFDDGTSTTYMKTETAAVVLDILEPPYENSVNRPVIAYWPNREKYYPGNIVAKDSEKGLFHVLFDDGDIRDEYYYQMRMLPYSC